MGEKKMLKSSLMCFVISFHRNHVYKTDFITTHTTSPCKECAAVIFAHGGLKFQIEIIVGVSQTAFSDALIFC